LEKLKIRIIEKPLNEINEEVIFLLSKRLDWLILFVLVTSFLRVITIIQNNEENFIKANLFRK